MWRILKDEKYTGTLIHNKKEQVSIGSKNRKQLDKEDWTIVRNAFEPIVTKKEFDEVQRNIKKPNYYGTQISKDILFKKIVCGKCGHDLRKYKYKGKSIVKYNCQYHYTTNNELCFDGYIYRDEIENVILDNIKLQIKILLDMKNGVEIKRIQYENEISQLVKEEKGLLSEFKRRKIKKSGLIEDLIEEKISEMEFKKLTEDIEKDIDVFNKKLDEIVKEKENIKSKLDTKKYEYILSILENGLELGKGLDNVVGFIDKILVYEKDVIEIVFNFEDILG